MLHFLLAAGCSGQPETIVVTRAQAEISRRVIQFGQVELEQITVISIQGLDGVEAFGLGITDYLDGTALTSNQPLIQPLIQSSGTPLYRVRTDSARPLEILLLNRSRRIIARAKITAKDYDNSSQTATVLLEIPPDSEARPTLSAAAAAGAAALAEGYFLIGKVAVEFNYAFENRAEFNYILSGELQKVSYNLDLIGLYLKIPGTVDLIDAKTGSAVSTVEADELETAVTVNYNSSNPFDPGPEVQFFQRIALSTERATIKTGADFSLNDVLITAHYSDQWNQEISGSWAIKSGGGTLVAGIFTAPATAGETVLEVSCSDGGVTRSTELVITVVSITLPPGNLEMVTHRLNGRTDLVMVALPPGTFIAADWTPAISVSWPLYAGIHEVTQEQWEAITAGTQIPPISWDYGRGDQYPAYDVNWYEALMFCNLASLDQGLTPVYSIAGSTSPSSWGPVPEVSDPVWNSVTVDWFADGFRLPSNAEWEYAARAGTTSAYYWGDPPPEYGDYSDYDSYTEYREAVDQYQDFWRTISIQYAWIENALTRRTQPLGELLPNQFGLYDICGNIYEYCWDWFDGSYYQSSPAVDPVGPDSRGGGRVSRGGNFKSEWSEVRSATRGQSSPAIRWGINGLRLFRTAE